VTGALVRGGRIDSANIAADAFGNVLGQALGEAISAPSYFSRKALEGIEARERNRFASAAGRDAFDVERATAYLEAGAALQAVDDDPSELRGDGSRRYSDGSLRLPDGRVRFADGTVRGGAVTAGTPRSIPSADRAASGFPYGYNSSLGGAYRMTIRLKRMVFAPQLSVRMSS
jgi:hypothetical protein